MITAKGLSIRVIGLELLPRFKFEEIVWAPVNALASTTPPDVRLAIAAATFAPKLAPANSKAFAPELTV